METFSALLAICAGNSPVTGGFAAQRPVTRSFDVFFDLLLNNRLSKPSWGWWFETPSRPLWRNCNDTGNLFIKDMPRCIMARGARHDNMILKYKLHKVTCTCSAHISYISLEMSGLRYEHIRQVRQLNPSGTPGQFKDQHDRYLLLFPFIR